MRPAASVTFARRIGLIGVLACFAAAAALAAEPRPDAAIKNKTIDASVLLDDKIKADAALAADCLAEGKKWLDENAAEAEASRQQDPAKQLKIGAVTLAPSTEAGKTSGLTFHDPPCAVGPYAKGEYVAFVPLEALKLYLTPEGTRIFSGEQPKGDDDGTQ